MTNATQFFNYDFEAGITVEVSYRYFEGERGDNLSPPISPEVEIIDWHIIEADDRSIAREMFQEALDNPASLEKIEEECHENYHAGYDWYNEAEPTEADEWASFDPDC